MMTEARGVGQDDLARHLVCTRKQKQTQTSDLRGHGQRRATRPGTVLSHCTSGSRDAVQVTRLEYDCATSHNV
ncbi:hypothetical protein ACET3X_000004 [Alternaria dauci]|uniref:Uncharacterized protein n=1 Tax=Alternaria dauci TaxID=48095 RepID=A0ABR3UTS4_9PLEO